MFYSDQQTIASYAVNSPEHVADVLLFVRLSIRRKFYLVQGILADVRERGIDAMPTQADKKSFVAIHAGADRIHELLLERHYPSEAIFYEVLSWPGFGIAKAGFVAQLLTGDIGCMDSHNITRYGLTPNSLRSDASWSTVHARCLAYFALCRDIGSAHLWDSWCELIAGLYPTYYCNAEAVSKAHVTTICWR